MKIHVLTENTACSPDFLSEHGLSFYIETENHNILFDFGQSDVFEKNALKLGLDLNKIDFAFLSHGHYDHGGGMRRFLELNNHADVYISPGAFGEHRNAQDKYIGLDIALAGDRRLKLVDKPLGLLNAELHPCFDALPYPLDSAGLKEKKDGVFIPDTFLHEQYLLINESGKRILISGCSHRGILNIALHFKPDIMVGGFHFMNQKIVNGKNSVLDNSAEVLSSFNCRYYTCHCTGTEQYRYLKNLMGYKLNYISSGQSIII